MKKRLGKICKKICTSMLAIAMTVGMVTLTPVSAAVPEVPTFEDSKTYSIVSTTTGKALQATGISWTDTGALYFNADAGEKVVEKAAFTISTQNDGNVVFTNVGNGVNLKCETGIQFVFNLEDGTGDNFKYTIEPTEGGYKLYSLGGQSYLGLGDNNRLDKVSDDNAEVFTFEEVSILNESVKIKHVASGKYVKAYADNDTPLTVDGESTDADVVYTAVYGTYNDISVMNFISKSYKKGLASAKWADDAGLVRVNAATTAGGWESIIVVANGDGTISFKDCEDNRYITVNSDKNLTNVGTDDLTADTITDNEKFILETELTPSAPTGLAVQDNTLEGRQVGITWDSLTGCMYSGYELERKVSGGIFEKIATLADTTYLDTGLELGTNYVYRVRAFNGTDSSKTVSEYSAELEVTTLNGERPVTPTGLAIKETGSTTLNVSWEAVDKADKYEIYEAVSAYAEYKKVGETTELNYDVTFDSTNKYTKYFKVKAVNEYGQSALTTEFVSLETELFGDHTLIFAETDDTATVDDILLKLYRLQADQSTDSQFKADHYQVYFKPGDYTELSCIYLGFYTSINGLGKTPYDVDLNNLAIPAYLSDYNATCNFWRSAENFSIINTGNEQGKAQEGSWRADQFNWGVAQAAPLRRVYSERVVSYDWNYGWASGGYVADCYFVGVDGENNTAGTWSGQQFYTRNTVLEGNGFGTTLNNFYQGVIADNLPTTDELLSGQGYSNWNIAASDGGQQVVTNIEETKKLSEKPFVYIDNGEYYVFVPDVQENTKGISWGEGKDNDGMGAGKSIPLSEFYIAKEGDTAATINEQIAAGKNIYFTPGVYEAETPILVNEDNTIILGTGMAAIIPTNSEGAMKVGDVEGVKIAGLIFDAGTHSEYLLTVGEEGTHTDHSDNPTVLQDLFFRVGGTTDTLTKADNALIINSDDTIGDHFWIWRADHGAGVAWDGNESQHGLIVNGDDVTCYALFNEHFQSYNTLWNGENGSTYFYQNETAYDPISQEAWMSHNGTVNGYSSYKVDNDVKNHYAVGLGIYNVFIYTGPTYDASEVSIQLDNAIEVPNAEGVIVENACIQTFANDGGAYQIINSILNGVGDSVSSGADIESGKIGEGWSRKFLISYNNGTAVVGKTTNRTDDQKGKYIGVDTIENVKALGDDDLDVDGLKALIASVDNYNEAEYTPASWAVLEEALADATAAVNNGTVGDIDEFLKYAMEEDFEAVVKALEDAIAGLVKLADKTALQAAYDEAAGLDEEDYTEDSYAALVESMEEAKAVLDDANVTQDTVDEATDTLEAAIAALVELGDKTELQAAYDEAAKLDEDDYTDDSYAALVEAMEEAKAVLDDKNALQEDIDEAKAKLEDAVKSLVEIEKDNLDDKDDLDDKDVDVDDDDTSDDKEQSKDTDTSDTTVVMPYAILVVCAAAAYLSLKRKRA